MHGLGEIVPILSLSSVGERAASRAEREFLRREERHGRKAHLELDDGYALTPDGLEHLTGCHYVTYLATEWPRLADRPEAVTPARSKRREKEARRQLADYEPTWQERVFAEDASRRRELSEQVLAAAREDAREHREAVEKAEAQNAETLKAKRMVAFDMEVLKEAVRETGLAKLKQSLNTLGLARPEPDRVVVLLDLIQEDDIPKERITSRSPRTARRELIPDEDRRRLHLTGVCATALRVAGELVGLLPVEHLELVAACEQPGVLGRGPSQPILQFRLSRGMVERMAWGSDPVALLRTLGPRMHWTTGEGFAPIPLWRPSAEPLAQSA
jgi:hypothetical protein